MRTDTALQCDVLDELASEPSIRATEVLPMGSVDKYFRLPVIYVL